MNTFSKDSLINNKIIKKCGRIVHKIRRVPPAFFLIILTVMLIVFVLLVPVHFWKVLWLGLRERSVLIGMLLVFCLVAVSLVWKAGQRIDMYVFSFFNLHGRRPRWLDRTMLIVTEFGNGIVTLAIAIVFYFAVNHILAYKYILGTLTLWLIVEYMKLMIRRARPYMTLTTARVVGSPAKGKSFPSGHTSQAFYTATMVATYFNIGLFLGIPLYLFALLVGVTRMYMGMHYPRDVIGGAILGTFWGFIGVIINGYLFH